MAHIRAGRRRPRQQPDEARKGPPAGVAPFPVYESAISTEDAFIQAILSDPRAAAPRLIYADWLEEHGDHASFCRAEYLRV
jgi:uncharacterized protein (TIGR02996 family)